MFDAMIIDSWSVQPELTFSKSDLSWNIANDPTGRYTPNILSELSYNDMLAHGAGVTIARLYPVNEDVALYADGHVNKAYIYAGNSQDSDYNANNRQGEFSRSYADIDNNDNKNYGFTLGLKTRWLNTDKDFLNFFIGREQQDVNITTTKGVIDFSNAFPAGYKFDNLNSTYNSSFASWSLGVGAEHAFTWGVLSLRYDYYDTNYDAKANWNLRDDFEHPVSFTHNGQGDGHGLQVHYSYPLTKALSLNARWQRVDYRIGPGYDQTFFIETDPALTSQGITTTSLVTRLNEVDYTTQQLQLGMEYLF